MIRTWVPGVKSSVSRAGFRTPKVDRCFLVPLVSPPDGKLTETVDPFPEMRVA